MPGNHSGGQSHRSPSRTVPQVHIRRVPNFMVSARYPTVSTIFSYYPYPDLARIQATLFPIDKDINPPAVLQQVCDASLSHASSNVLTPTLAGSKYCVTCYHARRTADQPNPDIAVHLPRQATTTHESHAPEPSLDQFTRSPGPEARGLLSIHWNNRWRTAAGLLSPTALVRHRVPRRLFYSFDGSRHHGQPS